MQDWLIGGMESLEGGLPGRVIDANATPADVLARPDVGLCFASGVAVAMGGAPIGYVRGTTLARLVGDAFSRSEREAREAREEVRRLKRNRRMLAAGLGHELRTPLSAISGYSELIALGLESGRTVAAASQNAIIWEAAQSLIATIDSMLDVARLEAGAVTLDEQSFALRPLAANVARMLATLADQRGATLEIDIDDSMPRLFADERMVRQILVNLAANAIKYGGDRCTVRIAARIDRHERMVIEVRDDGPGMSAEAIDAAMRPFRRGPGVSEALPGSGLGLPLVKAFADLHEARFQLLSAPSKGTRAVVTMPPGRVRAERRGRQEAFAFQRSSELFG
jgi:signal transduction histidine kinase